MLAKRSAQRDRTLFRDRAQPSETMASGIQDRRIKPLQLKIRQAARTVSVLKMVGRGWQTDRAGAVAIRLPYGLELPISRRERVALVDIRCLLKSVTG
jgi:hypothetical protein